MKNRKAKKLAKKFLQGKCDLPVVTHEFYGWETDGWGWPTSNPIHRSIKSGGCRVDWWVHWYAYRSGWDGCHWDHPLFKYERSEQK